MQPADSQNPLATLAEVVRGEVVESCHVGCIAVTDPSGHLVASAGNVQCTTFLRSAAKPFQAIPLIASGAADRFGFTEAEIALACGSHNGEPIHTRTAEQMLHKVGLSPADLKCGFHEPYNKAIAEEQRRMGQGRNILHNNCSGKHAGMLALSRHLGAPIGGYLHASHPVQISIRNAIAEFSGVLPEQILYGIDGCGVPTFALPVQTMAMMFARLGAPSTVSSSSAAAARRILSAMMNHPELVGGDHEFDTELMRATRGRLIAKMGAEGIWCAAVLPNGDGAAPLGIAFKIADGSTRARAIVAMEILHRLGILNPATSASLQPFAGQTIRNNRGENVGVIRAAVDLQLHEEGLRTRSFSSETQSRKKAC